LKFWKNLLVCFDDVFLFIEEIQEKSIFWQKRGAFQRFKDRRRTRKFIGGLKSKT